MLLPCIKCRRAASVPEDVDRNASSYSLLLLSIALPAGAATVRMAFGDNLPPYILVSSSSGIEVDIVREALAYRGHVLQPVFMPMGRIPVVFVAGKADAIMMDVGQDMRRPAACTASRRWSTTMSCIRWRGAACR